MYPLQGYMYLDVNMNKINSHFYMNCFVLKWHGFYCASVTKLSCFQNIWIGTIWRNLLKNIVLACNYLYLRFFTFRPKYFRMCNIFCMSVILAIHSRIHVKTLHHLGKLSNCHRDNWATKGASSCNQIWCVVPAHKVLGWGCMWVKLTKFQCHWVICRFHTWVLSSW